jgi:hypothetical protein
MAQGADFLRFCGADVGRQPAFVRRAGERVKGEKRGLGLRSEVFWVLGWQNPAAIPKRALGTQLAGRKNRENLGNFPDAWPFSIGEKL